MTTTENDRNVKYVEHIANTLDYYVQGDAYLRDDGMLITPDDFHEYDGFERYVEEHGDELNELGIWDYFTDSIYDIKWTLDSDKEYYGARIMVACGGPNVFVDTITGNVELWWWGDHATWPISTDAIGAIDDYFRELFVMW